MKSTQTLSTEEKREWTEFVLAETQAAIAEIKKNATEKWW
jgi:hypothetical protein